MAEPTVTLEFVYRTHYRTMVRWATMKRAIPQGDAEDIVSEWLVKAAPWPLTYDPTGGPLTTWLFRCVSNAAADWCRRRSAARTVHPVLVGHFDRNIPAKPDLSDPASLPPGLAEAVEWASGRVGN